MAANKRIDLFGDWILAKVYNETQELETGMTKSGIALPDTVLAEQRKNRADKAIVLDLGPDVKSVSVGKKVAFLRFAIMEIEFEKDKFILLREIDLIGII